MSTTTPEGKVKARVRMVLDRHPRLYQFWPVQTGRGSATLDCLVAYYGRMVAIETKAPGKDLTPRQRLCKRELEQAGVRVFVIDGTSDTDTVEELAAFLATIERRRDEAA